MTIVWNDQADRVLSDEQRALGPLLDCFVSTHLLVGGTAIALQLGHRRSVDFDLFCFGSQGTGKELFARIHSSGCVFDLPSAPPFWLSDEEWSELTLFFGTVKVQWIDFSRNPFDIPVQIQSDLTICGMPSLSLELLGAMKVYAMMYRAKRKDAVDVAMIMQHGYTLAALTDKAQELFKDLYKPMYTYETIVANERDMTETIAWLIDDHPSDEVIQQILEDGIKALL